MRVLVVNAGSSTLKWTLFDGRDGSAAASGTESWSTSSRRGGRREQIRCVLDTIADVDAIGHRVVHGGLRFRASTLIDADVRTGLDALVAVDRLHMLPALAGIDAATERFPRAVQVASFDTAFHATMPEPAAQYALPFEWCERWGLRRFGFHGLSVDHATRRAHELLGRLPAKMVVCHLGSGCSVTAVAAGRSIDTTMGFTPLEGVTMATRSGSVDPGVLCHLVARCGVSITDLEDVLANRSGLLGLSGISGDLRAVLSTDSPRARLAYEQFVWTLRRSVGAMAAVLGGVDALVFTGGIGENNARVRSDVATSLSFTGLRLGEDLAGDTGDRVLSTKDSAVAALLVHAREDLVVLRDVLRHAGATGWPPS